MKYRFRVLKEAANVPEYKDFNNLISAMIIAKSFDEKSYDFVMDAYRENGGMFSQYYKSPEIRGVMETNVRMAMLSLPTAKSNKEGTMGFNVNSIDTKDYETIYYLTKFDSSIKKNESAYEKVLFVYRCYVGNKIPNRASNNEIWNRQVFDNPSNYKMRNDDFCEVFSAYTLSFNFEGVDPNKLFLINNHFIDVYTASDRYQKLKKEYGAKTTTKKEPQESNDWVKIGSSSETLKALANILFKDEGSRSVQTAARVVCNALFPYKGRDDLDDFIKNKKDFDAPQLLVPKDYEEMRYNKLVDALSNNKVYKQYFEA